MVSLTGSKADWVIIDELGTMKEELYHQILGRPWKQIQKSPHTDKLFVSPPTSNENLCSEIMMINPLPGSAYMSGRSVVRLTGIEEVKQSVVSSMGVAKLGRAFEQLGASAGVLNEQLQKLSRSLMNMPFDDEIDTAVKSVAFADPKIRAERIERENAALIEEQETQAELEKLPNFGAF